MNPKEDGRLDEGWSKQRLDDSGGTSTDNTKCSVPELVGGHGPWQYRHWLAFFLASTCHSSYLFSLFPLTASPLCACSNRSSSYPERTKPIFYPETHCNSSHCPDAYEVMKLKTLMEPCHKFPGANFLSEEDTDVCSNIHLAMYAKCVYVTGLLFSGLTLHPLMFKFSRRAISFTSGVLLFASALATAWAPDLATFLILRTIISAGITNIYLISAFSLQEVVGDEYNLLYGLLGHIGWGLAHFLLPLISWLAHNWKQYSIILSTLPFILCIASCFITESIESFVSRGLWTRAEKVIRKAARSNGCSTQDIEQFTHNFTPQREQEKIELLPCSRKEYIKKYFQLILLFFVGYSASFLYFTSIWLTEWIKISRGTYFALAATTEIASTIILIFFTCFFSLRHLWSAATVATSASFMIMYAKKSTDYKLFSTFPYLLTTFFSSAAFTIIVYRTLFRSSNFSQIKWNALIICFGMCIGALTAIATDFQKYNNWNPKLFVIYGIPNLTIGASIGFIPDRYFKF